MDDGRIMIVDLEYVEFGTPKVKRRNHASAGYPFRQFKEDRESYIKSPWYAR